VLEQKQRGKFFLVLQGKTGLFSKAGDLVRKIQRCRETNKGVKLIPTFQISLGCKLKCI